MFDNLKFHIYRPKFLTYFYLHLTSLNYKVIQVLKFFRSIFKSKNTLQKLKLRMDNELGKFSITLIRLFCKNNTYKWSKWLIFSIFSISLFSKYKVLSFLYGSKFYIFLNPLKCKYSLEQYSGNSESPSLWQIIDMFYSLISIDPFSFLINSFFILFSSP